MEYKFSNQFNFVIGKKKREECKYKFVLFICFKLKLKNIFKIFFFLVNSIIPVSEQYVNQSSPIALVGQIHKLHCFFSG